jgi:hypothetical protein
VRDNASADSVTRQRAPGVAPDAAARDLFADCGGEVVLPGRGGALGLLRQHGERRLQPVREITRFPEGAAHRAVAMFEQRVEIVDERLHLRRIPSLERALRAFLHVAEPLPHLGERDEPGTDDGEPRGERGGGQDRHEVRAALDRQHDRPDGEQAERPEHRAHDHAAAERLHDAGPSGSMRYPRPRTVSMSDAPSFRRSRPTKTSTVFESRSRLSA